MSKVTRRRRIGGFGYASDTVWVEATGFEAALTRQARLRQRDVRIGSGIVMTGLAAASKHGETPRNWIDMRGYVEVMERGDMCSREVAEG